MAERIIWTSQALGDLNPNFLFIQRDGPRRAQLFMERVLEAVERIALFPRLGRLVPEFGLTEYREVLVWNYRLIYRVEEGEIYLLTVHHGSRPLDPLT